MDNKSLSLTVQNIVLIADIFDSNCTQKLDSRRDLEKSEPETVNQLIQAIQKLGRNVVHYQSPDELGKNASKHKNDLVLSIYGGESSRNRMALVPAVCETFGLKYVGPDVYGRVVAQDKEVSKRLALDFGLETPEWRIIRRIEDVSCLEDFDFPCVVKPLMEGSSIGITQSNLIYNSEQAALLAEKLIESLDQPVIVEQFIPGREVALSVIESNGEIHSAYSEIVIEDQPDFFQDKLFDAEEKSNPTRGRTVRNIDAELSPEDLGKINKFMVSFGNFGYCRVDGRHLDGKFYFLEITPDAWINKKGQFAMAFTEKGWSYEKVINEILISKD
ncbi:MAG: ATP-grasp domain-containing protein [Amphritea sp.]|nr:ATP-grasp domain-containing protein [Amphritea sp.]